MSARRWARGLLLVIGISLALFGAMRWDGAVACREAGGPVPPGDARPSASCEQPRDWATLSAVGIVLALVGVAMRTRPRA